MQSPKPNPALPASESDHKPAGERRGPAEPRSFAPNVHESADALARWPASWSQIDPARFIRLDPPLLDPAAQAAAATRADRRALIVIPCLNEAERIARVIAAILDDDGLEDPLVLVADGGSADGSREIVARLAEQDPRVKLLPNPGRLQSEGVNLAARLMGDGRGWLVRVDAHAQYPKNYVSTLIAEARRTGADTVVVAMETRGEGGFQDAVAAAQNSRLGAGGAAHRCGGRPGWVDHGHHALFRLETFKAIGGYDESFSHNEDAELDLRLARRGKRIWLTDEVRIIYHPRRTPEALWRQYFSYGRGRARTVLKHYAPLKLRQALPLAIAPAAASAAAAPLFWPLAAPALIWLFAALLYGLALGLRHGKAIVLAAGVAAIIMHLAWSLGFWAQVLKGRPRGAALQGTLATAAALR